MVEIIIILVTVAITFYILLPLFLKKKIKTMDTFSDILELKGKKEILEKNLSDLEFDYQMGKLADVDYNSMLRDYSNEISKISEEIKNIKQSAHSNHSNELVNKDIAVECPNCGLKNSFENKYCANCGFKLKKF